MLIPPDKPCPVAEEFCRRFLAPHHPSRYVLGRNEHAASIASRVDVEGFIDDFTDETSFMGEPIVKMAEVPKGSMVVSAVLFVVPLTALQRLKDSGLDCLDYYRFLKYSGLSLKDIDFLREAKLDIEQNQAKYEWVLDHLEDEMSRSVFMRLVNFRCSGDLDYMAGTEDTQDRQYFEEFIRFAPGAVFVDAGGFDGQTTLEFVGRCPEYRSVHFFEPNPKTIEVARARLSAYQSIHYYPMALAEESKTLSFDSAGASASRITQVGDIRVSADSLDHLVTEPVSFVKMDVEGAESIALAGSRGHILRDHPTLAISCYHKVDDLWRIPEQVLAIRDDYSTYLRHYTEGTQETVVFFVPAGEHPVLSDSGG